MNWLFKFFLLACILFPFVADAAIEQPASYVVDNAGIIEEGARTRLAGVLQELEQKTTVQMIVLTVPSTEGIPIEQFTIQQAQMWGLGQKGKD
ncbi:MAG: TPM domain-containing protein, partial [Desulfomonilia bacterium]